MASKKLISTPCKNLQFYKSETKVLYSENKADIFNKDLTKKPSHFSNVYSQYSMINA